MTRTDRLVAWLLAHRHEIDAIVYGRLEMTFSVGRPLRVALQRSEELDVDAPVDARYPDPRPNREPAVVS